MIHIVTFLTIYYLWTAIFESTTETLPYTLPEIVTYYVLAGLIHQMTVSYFEYEISDDIRLGNLNNFLLKPFSYIQLNFMRSFGWHTIQTTVGVSMYAVVIMLLKADFIVRFNAVDIAYVALYIFLSGILLSVLSFLLGTISLWFIQANSIYELKDMFIFLLSGFLIPFEFLPQFLQNLFSFLPFKYCIYTPIQIYLGRATETEIFTGLGILAIWILILLIFSNVLWKKGLQQFDGVGI
jgi:ABC-2 type transport system permease protein